MKPKITAELDFTNPVTADNDQHAHHTGWALDPDDKNCFVLTLHREDDSVLAVACYTFDHWMDVFENLKAAKEATDERFSD